MQAPALIGFWVPVGFFPEGLRRLLAGQGLWCVLVVRTHRACSLPLSLPAAGGSSCGRWAGSRSLSLGPKARSFCSAVPRHSHKSAPGSSATAMLYT
ncbi:hypothetical protein AALO_G00123740 [Alosa alosa]|uniref:Uncharacterized protein n=1 Tax=Alosa alosa TaxID=278164 RepID=A0AAV6GLA9_9TELE|nr:hypothetical protein AALO_G00123740 [Alosa alosa]